MHTPLIHDQSDAKPSHVKWKTLFVFAIFLAGFAYHGYNPPRFNDDPVGSSDPVAEAANAETPVAGAEDLLPIYENLRVKGDPKTAKDWPPNQDRMDKGAAQCLDPAKCKKILDEINKTEYIEKLDGKKETVPDWENNELLKFAAIEPELKFDKNHPNDRKKLMLWTGDWTYDDAFREKNQVYRLELTPLGRALGKVVGDENYRDKCPAYNAYIGGVYDQVSRSLVNAYGGDEVIVAISMKLGPDCYKGKTFSNQELPHLLQHKTIKKLTVFMRNADGSYPTTFEENKNHIVFEKEKADKWKAEAVDKIIMELLKANKANECNIKEHDVATGKVDPAGDPKSGGSGNNPHHSEEEQVGLDDEPGWLKALIKSTHK